MKYFKGLHKGERAFVIGNGPSLKKFNLSLLDEALTFGSNRIYLSGFVPTYYACTDILVGQDNRDEILSLDANKFFCDDLRRQFESDPTAHFLRRLEVYDGEGRPWFGRDLTEGFYFGGTVTYLLLQLAAYMGVMTVYLLGIDHRYTIPPGAEQLYQGAYISRGPDPNHFDPDYFGPGRRFHDPRLDRMTKAYEAARNAFALKGAKIYNLTPGSALEVFPKMHAREVGV